MDTYRVEIEVESEGLTAWLEGRGYPWADSRVRHLLLPSELDSAGRIIYTDVDPDGFGRSRAIFSLVAERCPTATAACDRAGAWLRAQAGLEQALERANLAIRAERVRELSPA